MDFVRHTVDGTRTTVEMRLDMHIHSLEMPTAVEEVALLVMHPTVIQG